MFWASLRYQLAYRILSYFVLFSICSEALINGVRCAVELAEEQLGCFFTESFYPRPHESLTLLHVGIDKRRSYLISWTSMLLPSHGASEDAGFLVCVGTLLRKLAAKLPPLSPRVTHPCAELPGLRVSVSCDDEEVAC